MTQPLQIEEDMAFQRRWWLYERVGWVLMVALVAAGLSGVFGRGSLSQKQTATPNEGLSCEYENPVRELSATQFVCRIRVEAESQAVLHLAQAYLDGVQVEEISPEPLTVESRAGELSYRFAVEAGQDTLAVSFRVKPQRAGSLPLRLRAGDAILELEQTVLP